MANHIVLATSGAEYLAGLLQLQLVLFKPKLHLYQNPVSLSINTVLGDFVECTFPGYPGAVDLDFSGAGFFDPTQHWVLQAQLLTYSATAQLPNPQQAIGYYVMDSTETTYLWAEQFPFRVWFRYKGDALLFQPQFGFLSEWG